EWHDSEHQTGFKADRMRDTSTNAAPFFALARFPSLEQPVPRDVPDNGNARRHNSGNPGVTRLVSEHPQSNRHDENSDNLIQCYVNDASLDSLHAVVLILRMKRNRHAT